MAMGQSAATRHYRWRELTFLVLPFLIMLVAMTQLLVGGPGSNPQAPFSPKSLPTLQDMVPVLGLIAALLVTNIIWTLSLDDLSW